MTDEPEEFFKIGKPIRHASPMNPIHIFFFHAFALVLVLWLMFGAVCGLTRAQDNDMSPHIKMSDMLLYYRLDDHIKAHDVVILRKNNTQYTGRIAAVSGDTVEITKQGKLLINGSTVIENEIGSNTPRYESFVSYPVTLGEGEYFILCDNRNGSQDSRYYGKVKKNEMIGTVITVIRRNNI